MLYSLAYLSADLSLQLLAQADSVLHMGALDFLALDEDGWPA